MKLTLEEYSSWLDKEVKKLVQPADTKGRKLLREARRNLDEAQRFFEDLSRKGDRDMAAKRDPVSYRAARIIGHSARVAADTLVRIQLPSEISWESLKVARDSLSSASRALRESRNQAGRELAGLYILDMRSYGGFVDRISRASERLTQFLESEGSSLQKARTLEGLISSIQEVKREIFDREQEKEDLVHSSRLLTDELHRLELEHKELSNGSRVQEILEIESELRKESDEFRTVTLAHLQRPLRKLRDLSHRGEIPLGPDEKSALERYIVSPYRSFLSRQAGPHIDTILRSLQSALQSGKMGFKTRKATRVMTQLDQLQGNNRLREKQGRGRELLSRRWKILQDPSSREQYQARKDLLSRLEDAKRRREEILSRIRALEEKSTGLSKRLDELVEMAEARTAQYLGRQVHIERQQIPQPVA